MILVLIPLLGLCTHVGRALRVLQPYRVVASDEGEVRMRCSYHVRGSPEEMRLALYRGKYGEEQVCAFTLNLTQAHFQTDGPVRCRGELSPGGIDLTVSGLRGDDTDLYRCRMEVLYPPPYLIQFGNGTIFYIPEKTDCPPPAAAQTQDETSSTSVILPIAVLASFVLIIIIVIISTYKFFVTSQRRRMYPLMAPVTSKRVDCRFGYENFL
ncbi:hypothetical protein SKAU_G00242280 [Synaphobranchus kaupii]|uniref:Immunoglobulin V-set domain-containing protein n=1 Tax=Synaphobranchus kaupii TaxID=118154 RepID=A0A9Q1IU09_SYNKA|nr:hypothetical protein SKAU_G00242280 [Synaphobranchus kaupii]